LNLKLSIPTKFIFALMKVIDVTLVTCHDYENPTSTTEYVQNVLLEDRLIAEALQAKGLRVYRTSWDNPTFDWATTEMAVVRTTWDYFNRPKEFAAWLDKVSQLTRLVNPTETLRWNMDKHYLQDLASCGVNIVPTRFIEIGETQTLQELVAESGWPKVIIKPAISGAARHTYRMTLEQVTAHEAIFKQLIGEEAMLLQPFMNTVETHGEVSHMVFGGKYSHSVLKRAKAGDFRVQDDHGGTVYAYEASEAEVQYAEYVTAQYSPVPVYARVDVMWDSNNQLALVELELIEPELWMRKYPQSAELFADALAKVMN
jgi:glutathione synthase/RimK-type ligase-like ATP-grasp enzyme